MKMIFIEVVQYGFAGVVGLLLGYQMLISFFALKGKKNESFEASRDRKFAVILIVNSQKWTLARSLYSLSGLVYPKNLYDLIVVVEKSDEKSVAIANKLGASVVECSNGQNYDEEIISPGSVGQFLQLEDYDAVIIFESDSLVSGNYLEVMNYYLEKGSKVIQSWDWFLPQPNHDSAGAGRIETLLSHYVKPMGRKMLGLPQTLRGKGVCISSDVIQEEPWEVGSTDIMGYGLRLQLKGIDIDFAPEASVLTERPQKDEKVESNKYQRRKTQRYAFKLLKAVFVQRSMRFFDIFVDMMTPSFKNTMFIVGTMGLLSISAWAMGWLSLSFFWMWLIIACLGIIYLSVGLFSSRDRRLVKSVFSTPIYEMFNIKKIFTRGGKQPERIVDKKSDIFSGELEEL